jgi:DnaJ-class molecular chaperone
MIVSAAKAAEAAGVLEVELDGLTSSAITSAYRAKARLCHPDHHGSTKLQEWSRVSWAKEVLGYWLAKRPETVEQASSADGPPCIACNGKGRLPIIRRGFGTPLTVQCATCKGLGTVIAEENDID